jgi:glutamate dehydrogenase/leucine dehydrogenase
VWPFHEYGSFVTSLRGAYVAAEDVGLNVEDLDLVFQKTHYTTCISPALGGSGNPSVPTAAGVAYAMEGAFTQAGLACSESACAGSAGPTPLAGASVPVQGTGNVGRPLIRFLLEKGVRRVIGAALTPAA